MSEGPSDGYVRKYLRTHSDRLSDEDVLHIGLPVKVWRLIEETLFDVVAELGPNALEGEARTGLQNAATDIDEELTKHGWPN